jgi:hypothetical protein
MATKWRCILLVSAALASFSDIPGWASMEWLVRWLEFAGLEGGRGSTAGVLALHGYVTRLFNMHMMITVRLWSYIILML